MPATKDSRKRIVTWVAVMGLMAIFAMLFSQCRAYTDERDVYAINNLHAALGSPPLPGWTSAGGDPCTENWQGIQCVQSNITSIILNGANLGGQLGDNLQNFTSIITIDLSNNHIGGSIPENLPSTMTQFFLSANQFTGTIPSSLSGLTLLSAMSVNNNLLTGELPDSFQSLSGLINLDLSVNNFNGPLPPSMESLSSLTTLHVQNNQLSGTLNVLQNLPIKDLNIENNLFSGPVPENLLSIPNFKKDGNPFNATTAPSLAPLSPPSPLSESPVPESNFANSSDGSSVHDNGNHGKKKTISTARAVGYALLAVSSVLIAALLAMLFISKYKERKQREEEIPRWQKTRTHSKSKEHKNIEHFAKSNNKMEREDAKAHELPMEPESQTNLVKQNNEMEKVSKHIPEKQKMEMDICTTETDILVMPPLVQQVIVKPTVPTQNIPRSPQTINLPPTVKSFSVASLQQYTNSFREENMIREGRFGNIYMAELPVGKVLAVLKLDNIYSNMAIDEFLELVLHISELRHSNITELVGYCAEFGQRLLVYNCFSKRNLYDFLHSDDDLKSQLSWNARIEITLGAAKALEYLHEGCQTAVVHQNIEPATILIDDELAVHVSECGLASLVSSHSVTLLSSRINSLFAYEAPEVRESGSYTVWSDVYSFGVVMLELLTGHKAHDSSRPRAEQHLVRWASPQLYDINALSKMVDPCISGRYPVKSLSRFADIIRRCIQEEPGFRPPMSEVVQDLTRMIEEAEKGADRSPGIDQGNEA